MYTDNESIRKGEKRDERSSLIENDDDRTRRRSYRARLSSLVSRLSPLFRRLFAVGRRYATISMSEEELGVVEAKLPSVSSSGRPC